MACFLANDGRRFSIRNVKSQSNRGMTAELVEAAVSQLKRREDAAGLHGLAIGLEGGQETAVPTKKTKKVNSSKKFGLRYLHNGQCFQGKSKMICAVLDTRRDIRSLGWPERERGGGGWLQESSFKLRILKCRALDLETRQPKGPGRWYAPAGLGRRRGGKVLLRCGREEGTALPRLLCRARKAMLPGTRLTTRKSRNGSWEMLS